MVGEATESLLEGIAQARHPLAAELVICEAIRAAHETFPDDAGGQDKLEALSMMLDHVVGHAEKLASVEALALLRACSALGPDTARSAARKSADRLVAAGVPDRPWASRVGRPAMLRAWHYGDIFGSQSSVGVLFDYVGREHALMVLVDHRLGGGIKDCWVAEGRTATDMRNRVSLEMAGNPDTVFEDIDAATAAEVLGAALSHPPCPEQPDQIEDVNAYQYLVRSRAEHLARLAGTTPGR